MFQITYMSEALGDISQVEEICAESIRNNQRDSVTGILLRRNGFYFQALEGPKEAVEGALIRIINDDRHQQIIMLSRMLGVEREFGAWSMTVCSSGRNQIAVLDRIRSKLDDSSSEIRSLFERAFFSE